MSDYQILDIGTPDAWRAFNGGFTPDSARDGRRIVDHELPLQFFGLSVNALEPGEGAGYWHVHHEIDELYLILEGQGQFGLDENLVEVGPGTALRVGPGLWRTWRARPDSPGQLRWLCVRGGGSPLPRVPDDGELDFQRAMPW